MTYRRNVANAILKHSYFKENNLEPFIPSSFIYKKGIMRGVPEDLTDAEIIQNLELVAPVANLQPVSIRRFDRKTINEEGKPEFIPTKTIQITFKGQVLPQHAFLYKVRYPVELYIPNVRFCTNCYRHGHSKLLCKS